MPEFKLTDACGCHFNDRITLELSPAEVERYHNIMKEKAEASDNYNEQKSFHAIVDYLSERLREYSKARAKYNKKHGGYLKGCPNCASENLKILSCDGLYYVQCVSCGKTGSACNARELAIGEWNSIKILEY